MGGQIACQRQRDKEKPDRVNRQADERRPATKKAAVLSRGGFSFPIGKT
jgi:hypothetical protein